MTGGEESLFFMFSNALSAFSVQANILFVLILIWIVSVCLNASPEII